MAYLFSAIGFPEGSRLTHVWNNTWADGQQGVEVASGYLVNLPADQHGELEADFLASHLPFHVGGVGGRYPNGDCWFFVMCKVPAQMSSLAFAQEDPFWVLRDSLDRALAYNPHATVGATMEWTAQELREVYAAAGSGAAAWPIADLLRGLLAECCNVPLGDIAAGYPLCAFPHKKHTCQNEVFNDAFVAWQLKLSAQDQEPLDGGTNSTFAAVSAVVTEPTSLGDQDGQPEPDVDGGNRVNLDQVEERVRRLVEKRHDGGSVMIHTSRVDGDQRFCVMIFPLSLGPVFTQFIYVATTGIVELAGPYPKSASKSGPPWDGIPTFDDDDAVCEVMSLVQNAVGRAKRMMDRQQPTVPLAEPDLPVDAAVLASACARWQGNRDSGSTLLRAGATVILGEQHYFRAAFITRSEQEAATDPDVLAEAAALLLAVDASPARTADDWCVESGLPKTAFAGRGLAAKPMQDQQILDQLDRGTIRMPLWGVSLDPVVARSYAGAHPRWMFHIVGEFRAIPAWLHSGVKADEQELICGGEFQVLSMVTEGSITTVRLQYLDRIGHRIDPMPLVELTAGGTWVASRNNRGHA